MWSVHLCGCQWVQPPYTIGKATWLIMISLLSCMNVRWVKSDSFHHHSSLMIWFMTNAHAHVYVNSWIYLFSGWFGARITVHSIRGSLCGWQRTGIHPFCKIIAKTISLNEQMRSRSFLRSKFNWQPLTKQILLFISSLFISNYKPQKGKKPRIWHNDESHFMLSEYQ